MSSSSFVGKQISELQSPAFVVSMAAVETNCKAMLERAAEFGIKLRGQTKTHKCVESGVMQTGGSNRCIVTSTLVESEMYADAGFDDILYGYPILECHMKRNFELRRRLKEYHMMVDKPEAVDILAKIAPPEGKKWSVFLKIDCGNKRAGVWWSDDGAVDVAKALAGLERSVDFQGLYAHCGNSYASVTDPEDVRRVRDETIRSMVAVTDKIRAAGVEVRNVGTGSTPSCSHSSGAVFNVLTEIHPGNYVFYDAQQMALGSCAEADIAGRVMTRVVCHQPARGQLLVDCGFTALTMQGFQQQNGTYALIQGHPNLKLSKMTQEIGFVEAREGETLDLDKFPVGTLLYLLPFHACATAAQYPVYYVHDKSGIIRQEWKPCRGW